MFGHRAVAQTMSPEYRGNLELAAWMLLAGLFWLAVMGALRWCGADEF